jgi:hypothetical protein
MDLRYGEQGWAFFHMPRFTEASAQNGESETLEA